MKFGKRNPVFQNTDLLYDNLMRAALVPQSYDSDKALGVEIDNPMFANDVIGDCVIAGRAHQTRRFEFREQQKLITISEDEVKAEYFDETGGDDSGLVVSKSLKRWRKQGWTAANRNYKIKGYARLRVGNIYHVHSAMYADLGVGIGFTVPQTAMEQFDAGEPWDVINPFGTTVGGHYVYLLAYGPQDFECISWGKRQEMTSRFFNWYCDECWAIFDAVDTDNRKKVLNLAQLDTFLRGLA